MKVMWVFGMLLSAPLFGVLTNDSVLKMLEAGLSEDTIVLASQSNECEFTLDVDNVFLGQDDQKHLFGSLAVVEGMSIEIKGHIPVQVSVSLSGYLPDGCTKIHEIGTVREGKVFKIQIISLYHSSSIILSESDRI